MLHILPVMCSGGSSAGGAAPTLSAVVATEVTPIACGGGWTISVAWTLDFFNDAAYEIQIRDKTSTIVASGLATSSSPEVVAPPDTGDPGFTGFMHDAEYTVEVVRKSDSAVVDSMLSNELTVETGPAC